MDATSTDSVIQELASTQHGVFTYAQCRARGVESRQLFHRLDRAALHRVSPVVLRLAGAPVTPLADAMAAVLDAGGSAAISHHSAAAMWGLPGFELQPLHVVGTRSCIRRTTDHLATVHEPRALLDHHVTELDGVAVTTPSRLVFDLAGVRKIHPKRLERVLDTALSRNLVSPRSLDRVLGELGRRGRPGITLMRELLADRDIDYRPPESGKESRFQELAHRASCREFVRQIDVGDEDGWIGRVDFVDRARSIIVEVDTSLHHGSVTDRRRDADRRARLRGEGWEVIVFTDVDLFDRPDEVVAQLSAARRRAAPAELAGSDCRGRDVSTPERVGER